MTSHEGSTFFGCWKLGLLDVSYMISQMFLSSHFKLAGFQAGSFLAGVHI